MRRDEILRWAWCGRFGREFMCRLVPVQQRRVFPIDRDRLRVFIDDGDQEMGVVLALRAELNDAG
jgi:hypothetical protein